MKSLICRSCQISNKMPFVFVYLIYVLYIVEQRGFEICQQYLQIHQIFDKVKKLNLILCAPPWFSQVVSKWNLICAKLKQGDILPLVYLSSVFKVSEAWMSRSSKHKRWINKREIYLLMSPANILTGKVTNYKRTNRFHRLLHSVETHVFEMR